TVKLWDIRKGKNHCGEIVVFDSMTFVQFSPVTERQFVTSSNSAFSKKSRIPFLDDSDDILVKYITTLSKNNKTARPDISSVTFHPSGTMLCAMISRYHPTLYDVAEETPLCIFSSNYNKESNTCYSNKGTFKQAHFGGPNGDYILTGSDDFRVYVWKIPDLNLLKANKEISPTTENDSKDVIQDSIIKIYENSNPEYVLGGHRSIVNTVLWHPHLPYIFSSEKLIKIYSAFPFSDNDNEPKEAFKQREKYPPSSLYHIFGLSNSDLSDSIEEDVDTLRFFDNILRIEQNNDPYWGPNSNNNNSSTSSNSTTNPFINQLPWDWHNRNFHNHFTFPTFEDFNRLISSNTNSTIFGEDDDYRSFILDEDEDDYISNLYEEEEADDDDDEGDDYALSFERFFAVTREIVGGQMRRDSSFTMDFNNNSGDGGDNRLGAIISFGNYNNSTRTISNNNNNNTPGTAIATTNSGISRRIRTINRRVNDRRSNRLSQPFRFRDSSNNNFRRFSTYNNHIRNTNTNTNGNNNARTRIRDNSTTIGTEDNNNTNRNASSRLRFSDYNPDRFSRFSSNSSNTGDPTTTTTSNNNNSTSTNETNNTVFGPVFIGPERMNYDITNNTGINIPSGTNGSSHHFRPL
ncbi:10981_t:CDS:10, partial [Entrophospora sp. SA101]